MSLIGKQNNCGTIAHANTFYGAFVKLSIVIPIYNEKNTIHEILKRVRQTPFEKEIIIVDDYYLRLRRM